MFVVGIDENGLGPQLGPLIATAITLEAPKYQQRAWKNLGDKIGVDDSKATSAFGKMGWCESIALAIVDAAYGTVPKTADELFSQVGYESIETMQKRCPSHSHQQCWGPSLTLPIMGGDIDAGRAALVALKKRRIHIRRARSVIACVRHFNDELKRCGSKLGVDLRFFEQLLLDVQAHHPTPFTAICGMVGGIRRYRSRFSLLPAEQTRVLEEKKGRSAYTVEGLGDIAFEVSSDANHLPVALASMLGKYLREVSMLRQNTFYRTHLPEIRAASGYHDSVTQKFVRDTESLRKRLKIADGCFRRHR